MTEAWELVIPDRPPVLVSMVTTSWTPRTAEAAALWLETAGEDDRTCPVPPWPIVMECYGHRRTAGNVACRQCVGDHDHLWVTGPRQDTSGMPGLPVRCTTCGGRKCDISDCRLRRHHSGDHEPF